MTLGSSLYGYLMTQAGLTALIGTRVYPLRAEQGTTSPCVVYEIADEGRDYAIFGASEMHITDVAFRVMASDYLVGWEVYRQLELALDRFVGTMGDVTVYYFVFGRASDAGFDDLTGFSQVRVTFQVFYRHA